MAATLIQETDMIDVSSLSMLIYGPPGAWKTSLAQTADGPLTMDFDRGAHRSFNRKAVMRFDRWADVDEARAELTAPKYRTVVADTVGRALDSLASDIISANAKHGSASGGLTLQGYGVLKARFGTWVNLLRTAGKDVVMIAHEKEERDGDDRYMRPDIIGGSYTEVMKFTDLVGYLNVDRQGKRWLDFNPSDRHIGKNAAGWKRLEVPDLKANPRFLAELLADAKTVIGKTAEASAQLAQEVNAWVSRLDTLNGTGDLNALCAEMKGKLKNGAKDQVWHAIQAFAAKHNLEFDKKAKVFVEKAEAA